MNGPEDGTYRRSTYCSGGTCVEVAALTDGFIAVRDSKDLSRPEHRYTPDEWVAFVRGVKAGQFDFGLPASINSVQSQAALS